MAREVYEEVKVRVKNVIYRSSQPWPFPSSLMLGFTARATTTQIQLRDNELEDARWFSRDEARAMLDGRHPDRLLAPNPMAIAHHIVRAWVGE